MTLSNVILRSNTYPLKLITQVQGDRVLFVYPLSGLVRQNNILLDLRFRRHDQALRALSNIS